MTTKLTAPSAGPAVTRLDVGAYTIATDVPESDGTIAWDATTIVVVEAHAGDACGLGYAYCDAAAAQLIEHTLADVVHGRDAMATADGLANNGGQQLVTSGRDGSFEVFGLVDGNKAPVTTADGARPQLAVPLPFATVAAFTSKPTRITGDGPHGTTTNQLSS